MIRCATCTFDNPDGSISCSMCTQNIDLQGVPVRRTTPLGPAGNEAAAHAAHIGKLPERGVAIYIGQSQEPIIVIVHDKVTLGRRKDIPAPDLVDLTPYSAYQMGVSRNHAILTYRDNGYYLHDVGSVNGTWLNGQRLKAYELYALQSGSALSLGQLAVFVYF